MQRNAQRQKLAALAGVLVIAAMIGIIEGQQAPAPVAAPGRGAARRGRFTIYPADAVNRGLSAYNTTCGYCHGERGKSGKAGPDLIASLVTLHDEDGVQIREYVRGTQHSKVVKIDAPDSQLHDIAAYLHSRVVFASGRGNVYMEKILIGDPKAGEQYFRGTGGCIKCHSPEGDLKGVGAKYDPATLQERLVMPRTGRGGFGRAAGPNPTAPFATVTLPSGEKLKGSPLRVTDFDVTLRFDDGSTRTWAREHGVPKVEITDPLQAHIDIMTTLKDTDMHNLTAYLATLK